MLHGDHAAGDMCTLDRELDFHCNVEEFLSRLRLGTFLLDTYNAYRRLSMGGYGENRFLVLKVTKRPPIGLKF